MAEEAYNNVGNDQTILKLLSGLMNILGPEPRTDYFPQALQILGYLLWFATQV